MRGRLAPIAFVIGVTTLLAQVDATSIIERSVEANKRDWDAAPGYNYVERDRAGIGFKTYHVSMILGSPYRQLIAQNDEPLSTKQQEEEQRKFEEAVAQRQRESPDQRQERVAAYERERRRDNLMLNQLTLAFDFRFAGQQKFGERTVWVLQATPKKGYVPPNRDTEALTGMQGKLWIDTETNQWVRVEAQVIRPVWIEGFLARVEPGTRFALEYAPVTSNVWLPTHFAMKSRAKVLLLFRLRNEADETYSRYEKVGAETSPQ